MHLHEVMLSQYSPAKCSHVEALDIEAVRRNFNEIKTNSEQTDMALHQLHTRLEKMEAFYSFAAQQHPYVLDGFLAATAAKARIGAVASPPPKVEDMDMQQLELRTLAAIGKLP